MLRQTESERCDKRPVPTADQHLQRQCRTRHSIPPSSVVGGLPTPLAPIAKCGFQITLHLVGVDFPLFLLFQSPEDEARALPFLQREITERAAGTHFQRHGPPEQHWTTFSVCRYEG